MWTQTFLTEADNHEDSFLYWEYEVEFAWEDFGIGPYEFWGRPGVDMDWQPVINGVRRRLVWQGPASLNPNGVKDAGDVWEDYQGTEAEERGWINDAEDPETE